MHLGRTNQPIASPHWLVAHFRRNEHIYSSSKNVQSGSSGQVVLVRNYRSGRIFESWVRSLKPGASSKIDIYHKARKKSRPVVLDSRFSYLGGNFESLLVQWARIRASHPLTKSLVNLRNRMGEGRRRRQTLCDKRDNNFGWNNFSFKRIFL